MPVETAAPAPARPLADAIADYRRAPSRLGLYDLLRPFVAACYEVAAAHARGAAHLALTPRCILVGEHGRTAVSGWDRPAATNGDAYAAAFLAPEQARGDAGKPGPAADVYALGAILYALLTGQPPHTGDPAEVLARVREGLAWQPRMVAAGVPSGLEGICLTAMDRDPADRYRSAAELAREVERWMAGERVHTNYVEPPTVRLLRLARSNRGLAVLAGLLLLSWLAVGVAVNVIRVERRNVREAGQQTKEQLEAAQQREKLYIEGVNRQRAFTSDEVQAGTATLRALALKAQRPPDDGTTLRMFREDVLRTTLDGARQMALRADLGGGSDLAAAHDRINLAELFAALGQTDEARRHYERAVMITRPAAKAQPDNVLAQRAHTLAARGLGLLCLQQGQPSLARNLAHEAHAAAEAWAEAEPNNPQVKREEALCLELLADASSALHDRPAAREAFDRLIATVKDYADPNNVASQIDLANSYIGRGRVERLDYRFDEALPWYQRAVAILQPLDKDGRLKAFPQEAARLKEVKEAVADCNAVLKAVADINYALNEPEYRARELLLDRAGALARRGKQAEAVATAEKLRGLKPDDGANLFNVARALALANSPRRAVEALRAATDHGFRDVERIESESDLDVLHADADYRALIGLLKARRLWLAFPALP